MAFGVEKLDDLADKLARDPRAAAAPGARRQSAVARQAEIDRRLDAEGGLEGTLPGDRADRRGGRPRRVSDPALLAARPGPVHHAPGRDHEGPRDGRPERRHVPDAEDRPELDVHALADPQGRPCRPAGGARRKDPRRRGARARSRDGILGERAAAEAHRRADGRRLPQGLRRRARQVQDRGPRGAGATPRSCSRAGSTGTTSGSRGRSATTRASTRPPRSFRSSVSPRSRCGGTRSTRRSSSASRRPRTNGSRRRPSASSCRRSG